MRASNFILLISLLLALKTKKVYSFAPLSQSSSLSILTKHGFNVPDRIWSTTSTTSSSAVRRTQLRMIFGKKPSSTDNGASNQSPTFNGKSVKAKVGEKVSAVASRSKIPITYSCRKGDCGTCEIMMNGYIVKACQAKITSGKCDMKSF
jgi:ferredoxin